MSGPSCLIRPGMTGMGRALGEGEILFLSGVECDVRVSAFLCLLLVDGDDGGIVDAVWVSVTGHSSDLMTLLVTVVGAAAVAAAAVGAPDAVGRGFQGVIGPMTGFLGLKTDDGLGPRATKLSVTLDIFLFLSKSKGRRGGRLDFTAWLSNLMRAIIAVPMDNVKVGLRQYFLKFLVFRRMVDMQGGGFNAKQS